MSDEQKRETGGNDNEPKNWPEKGEQRPEPPAGWRVDGDAQDMSQPERNVTVGTSRYFASGIDVQEFESARKLNLAAQIVALVSLVFGGVLASTVAIVLAVISYRKFSYIAQSVQEEDVRTALRRSGVVAIVMSCIALVLNAVSVILLMPVIDQIVQTGDYSALFGGQSTGQGGSGSTTWG